MCIYCALLIVWCSVSSFHCSRWEQQRRHEMGAAGWWLVVPSLVSSALSSSLRSLYQHGLNLKFHFSFASASIGKSSLCLCFYCRSLRKRLQCHRFLLDWLTVKGWIVIMQPCRVLSTNCGYQETSMETTKRVSTLSTRSTMEELLDLCASTGFAKWPVTMLSSAQESAMRIVSGGGLQRTPLILLVDQK